MNEWNPSRPQKPSTTQKASPGRAKSQSRRKLPGADVLAWWYRLTTPEQTSGEAGSIKQEKMRRVRLASTLLLLITIIWLVSIPIFFITLSSDPATLPVTVVGLLVIAVLLFLNRRGWVAAVAWLLIALIYLSEILILRNNEATLGANEVAVFDLLVYAELLAVSLLPSLSVFPVSLCNCAFILVAVFSSQPVTAGPDSQPVLVTNLLVEPLTLQLFVAVVTYLWVASTEREKARADQAELMAALERRSAEDRRQLEVEIQQLLGNLTQVANGEFQTRVTLSQDRSLWRVGMALNTLIARLQSADVAEQRLRQTEEEVAVLTTMLREARAGYPARWQLPNESLLAPLAREFAGARPPSSELPGSRQKPLDGNPGGPGKSHPNV